MDDLVCEQLNNYINTVDSGKLSCLNIRHAKYPWIKFGAVDCCTYMMYITRVNANNNYKILDED